MLKAVNTIKILVEALGGNGKIDSRPIFAKVEMKSQRSFVLLLHGD